MERDGKTYCDRHPNVESALRCSRCEKYICPKCAVLTPVGYRCRECGHERSATHSLSLVQLILGSSVGFALAFAASAIIPGTIGFFIIFAGAIVGSFIGQVVVRIVGRKSSMAVGAFTALGYLLGAIARPLAMIARDGESAGDVAGLIFGNPWSLIFACIAAVVSWGMLR